MRLEMRISSLVLLLIFIIFFVELNKEFYLDRGINITDPLDQDLYNSNQYWITLSWPFTLKFFKVNKEHFKVINRIQTIIYYIIVFLLVIGFISYGGEIHDTVRKSKNLTWIDVITNTSICKLENRKSFLHYLKVGLGLKL